jgi:hypothetical protein
MAMGEWFLPFQKITVPSPSKVKPSNKNNEQPVLDMPLCMPDLENEGIMFLQNFRNHSPNSTMPHPSSSWRACDPYSLTSASFTMMTHTDVFCFLPPPPNTHRFQIILDTV